MRHEMSLSLSEKSYELCFNELSFYVPVVLNQLLYNRVFNFSLRFSLLSTSSIISRIWGSMATRSPVTYVTSQSCSSGFICTPHLQQDAKIPMVNKTLLHFATKGVPKKTSWNSSFTLGPYCLRCNSPPAFYDKAMIAIDESMLDWCNTAEPASILAADPKFGLFVACGVVVLILVILSVAIVLHSRWHAAHYYTHEEDRPEIGTPPIPPDYDHVSEGFDNLFFENNGNKPKMIATIEEIAYEPHYTSNGNRKPIYAPQLTSFKARPNSRPVSSSSPTPPNNQSDFNR